MALRLFAALLGTAAASGWKDCGDDWTGCCRQDAMAMVMLVGLATGCSNRWYVMFIGGVGVIEEFGSSVEISG